MKKTKIVATMGPAINNKEKVTKLIESGLNVLRVNFSHAIESETTPIIEMLHELNDELNTYVAWMCDTKGPEIRTHKMENNKVILKKGEYLNIHDHEILGTNKDISTTLSSLNKSLKVGDTILLDDGLIELEVVDISDGLIKTLIKNNGELGSHKGINIPGVSIDMPYLSEKDINDITYACNNGATYIAASFVRSASDIKQIRDLCLKTNNEILIIAKIENHEGIKNIDEIIEAADGIMVARGDLGTEIPMEDVPLAQLDICAKCNQAGKPVIIATHMLESMQHNPRPTRAEVGDVARAVTDGADAVMLSGETAMGEYPILALESMAKIVSKAETIIDHKSFLENVIMKQQIDPYNGIGIAAVELAASIGAKGIFTFTESGATAKEISRYRPTCPIYALSKQKDTLFQLSLNWGVKGIEVGHYETLEEKYLTANKSAKDFGIEPGSFIIITGGHPNNTEATNFLKISVVE